MKTVGVKSLDDLVDRTVPHSIRLDEVCDYSTVSTPTSTMPFFFVVAFCGEFSVLVF